MSIILNENIQSNSPKSLDNKYMVDGVTPYTDVAHVNSVIPLTYRSIGLKVNIANVDYWYKDGVADVNLIPFVSGGITIQQDGIDLPVQQKLNVKSVSLLATDDNANDRTNLDFTGDVCTLRLIQDIQFGVGVNFTHTDGGSEVDNVSADLLITRGLTEWLYNPNYEISANSDSPTKSAWYRYNSPSDLANLSTLTYLPFISAVNNNGGVVIGLWIMIDYSTNIYWLVDFTSYSPDTIPSLSAFDYLYPQTVGLVADGTIITIGTRTYTYDLLSDTWNNLEGGSTQRFDDCVNSDTLSVVIANGDILINGFSYVSAKISGSSGNLIPTNTSNELSVYWNFSFPSPSGFLQNGQDGVLGGGFSYQRLPIIVLCDGTIHFADGTQQSTAPSIIQNKGVSLPQRPFVDYQGSGVDVTDVGGKTVVTINGAKRKIINVDATFGDLATASLDPYNQSLSFPDLQSASSFAQDGDLIFVSAGNYTTVGNIAKNGVDWYFCPNAIVTGATPFRADGISFNVYGFGTFINPSFAQPFFFIRVGSVVNITCNTFINQAPFYGCVYAEYDCKVNFTAFGEVDCSFNIGIAFKCDFNSVLVINAPIVKCSHGAYNSDGGQIIANVGKTILYDIAGDFTTLGNNYAGIFNNSVGGDTIVIVNGDLFTEQTIDGNTFYNSALLSHLSVGGTLILNCSKSRIRLAKVAWASGSPNVNIIINGEVENIQESGEGVYTDSGKIILNNAKIKLSDLSNTSAVRTTVDNKIILNNAVLVCGASATESITASSPKTIKVYSAYANKPLNVNITNSIVGTNVIVDAGIE